MLLQISLLALAVSGDSSEVRRGSACFNPSGYNNGIENANECGPSGSTGLRWCEATRECIRGPTCPECENDKHIWCKESTSCCEYDCTKEPDNDVCCECSHKSHKPGCDADDKCEENVCAKDDFCCRHEWDKDCAKAAKRICKSGTLQPTPPPTEACIPHSGYDFGVYLRTTNCDDDELYCRTTDKCIPKSDKSCPQCDKSGYSEWCQLMGGGKCCKEASKEHGCTNYDRASAVSSAVMGMNNYYKKRGKNYKYNAEMVESNTIGGACFNPSGFNNGVENANECGPSGSTGLRWCAATRECIRGAVCPECYDDKHIWCKETTSCCDYDCTDPDPEPSTTEAGGGAACFNPSGYNNGVENANECGPSGSTGERWCEATRECIRGAVCPECENDKHIWCKESETCCEYDCTKEPEEECIALPNYVSGVVNDYECEEDELYCETKDECNPKGSVACPQCTSEYPEFHQLIGGGKCCKRSANSFSSVIGMNRYYNDAKAEENDKYISKLFTVDAIATFKSSKHGIDGSVKVDENGNVFIDLDVSKFDMSHCDKSGHGVIEYAIYTQYDEECSSKAMGEVFNPFGMPSCSDKIRGDKYFECSIGDLSARFGAVQINKHGKVEIKGNISEDAGDNAAGFCASRLTPESLFGRSVVFYCGKSNLFCAPFEIVKG